MNRFEAQVRSVVEAVRVVGPDGFVWQSTEIRVAADGPAATIRRRLVTRLADRLYGCFFRPGRVVEHPEQLGQSLVGRTRLANQLARAHTSRWSCQAGWRVLGHDGPCTVLERAGLRVWASPEQIGANHREHGHDDHVALHFPPECFDAYPGYYVALGETDLGSRPEGVARVYWNVRASGAAVLVAELTGRLNGRGIAFRLKLPNRRPGYRRADAAVLYIDRADLTWVSTIAPSIRTELGVWLEVPIPALTCPIVPGVSYAHDPGTGESFGHHRCNLIAEGLVRASAGGRRSDAGRVAVVETVFLESGLRLSAPYLSPHGGTGT